MSSPTRDLPIKQCRSHVTKYSCCNLLPENGMSHFFVGVYLSSRKRLDDEEAKKNATLTESFPQNPIWLVEQIFGGGSSTRNNATQPKSSIFISAVLFFVDSCLLYLFLFWSVVVAFAHLLSIFQWQRYGFIYCVKRVPKWDCLRLIFATYMMHTLWLLSMFISIQRIFNGICLSFQKGHQLHPCKKCNITRLAHVSIITNFVVDIDSHACQAFINFFLMQSATDLCIECKQCGYDMHKFI